MLRFDPRKRTFIDVVIENPALCTRNVNDLDRPEGLVFSPGGDLYMTSFRQRSLDPNDPAKADDNDRILIIPKQCLRKHERHDEGSAEVAKRCPLTLDRIDLWRADRNQERAFAQALLAVTRKLASTKAEKQRHLFFIF